MKEESHRLGQRRRALTDHLLNARDGNVGRDDERDVFLGERVRGHPLDLNWFGRHLPDEGIHIDLESAGAGGQAERAAGGRRELTCKRHIDQVTTRAGSVAGVGIGAPLCAAGDSTHARVTSTRTPSPRATERTYSRASAQSNARAWESTPERCAFPVRTPPMCHG